VGETRERGLIRHGRAALVAFVVAGLLAVVALAARSSHPGGGGGVHVHQRSVPDWVANDLLTIVVIGYALAVIAMLVVFWMLRDEWRQPKGRSWLRQLAVFLAIMVGVSLLGWRLAELRHQQGGQGGHAVQTTGAVTQRTPTLPNLPAARRPARFDWVFAAVLGAGLVLLAVILLRRRRPDDEVEDEEPETVEEELTAVVSDTIDDLRREADPRRAVIAAYARMERVLGQHGQPREPSEAPFEYLTRVLVRLRVRPAAVRDLTELFERAKFSTHDVDQRMKERAISALVSVRDDLQAVPG
jgi:hypothetical protein